MEIRLIKPEEQAEADRISSIAFVNPMQEKSEYLGNVWGCFSDQGKLESIVKNWPFTVYYDGAPVPMSGIGDVASLPETRMQGGVRALISEILRRDQDNGVVFSALYPFSHTYYRQYGYEVCAQINIVQFPIKSLSKYRHHVSEVRLVEQLSDARMLDALRERFAQHYNMAVKRDAISWKHMLQGDIYQAQSYRYALSKNGKVVAYLFFKPKTAGEDHAKTLRIIDFAYDGREGLHALFGFLYKLSSQYQTVKMELPCDLPMDTLLDEPYDITQEPYYARWMARLVCVEEGLSGLRRPRGDWQCSIAVRDDFLPHNSGTYQLQCSDTGIDVLKTKSDTADLSLSIQTLTQLCLGYLSLDMALLKEDVTLCGNRELLAHLFQKKPIYMSDKF